MDISSYPPQEPLSDAGKTYAAECLRRGAGITGDEFRYGVSPYQSGMVFRPQQPNGCVLMFLHGGGWVSGYKEWMAFMAPAITAGGVTLVTVGYRLAPAHAYPAGLNDVALALNWISHRIEEYGADPRKIFIGGHSAGGHYAALLTVRRGWLDVLGLPQDTLRGCLPISGVYQFTAGSGLPQRPRFLGDDPDNDRDASPQHNIEGEVPPFLLAHGSQDFPHLITQAENFERALREHGATVTRLVLEGRDHFSASYAGGEADGPWVPPALDFIARHA